MGYNTYALNKSALIAQLDRASGYGPEGWEFESLWVHHLIANRGFYLGFVVFAPKSRYSETVLQLKNVRLV